MKVILGKKIEMSQRFQEEAVAPVTLIKAGPCFVTQIKTKDKDGYEAVQIGFEKKKNKKIKKTEKGKEFRYLKEFKIPALPEGRQNSLPCQQAGKFKIQELKIGSEIKVDIFKPGEKVIVSGISKGKGFAGVMKRHGFHGQPATHGTKHDARHAGSIGSTAPQRVLKGKKMAGRLGGQRVTIKNLEVIEVMPEKDLLVLKGAVPGARGSLLEIKTR